MTPPFRPIDPKASFPQLEEDILQFWEDSDCFRTSLELRKDAEDFIFYDGPPFATGLPHYGHILAGTLKDVIPRYQTMLGKRVPRVFGWDCHGFPVEHEIEKKLGLKNREDIEKYGIQNFNEQCRSIVLKYTSEWQKTVERMGRWVDFQNGYKTMDSSYTEGVMWAFAELWKKGFIYEGKKIISYSPKLGSTLSNFEANLNYKDINDPALTVKFALENEPNTSVLAWTTTPWTLPSNLALCVHPDIEYVKVRCRHNKTKNTECFILAKSIFEKWKKLSFQNTGLSDYYQEIKPIKDSQDLPTNHPEIQEIFRGKTLIGKHYTPLFLYYKDHENSFQVLGDTFVSDSDGTGIVHLAPAFGEDDNRICQKENIEPVDPITKNGYFDTTIPELTGLYFRKDETVEDSLKDNVNKRVIQKLEEANKILKQEWIRHSYPFCWRTDCALMYRGIHTVFVDVQKVKQELIATNKNINWTPSHIQEGRFGKMLEGAPDWAISRSRYWGAPIPLWKCEACEHREVAGSIKEIGQKARKTGSLITLRHGEGEHNALHTISTTIDDNVSLTEIGKKQVGEAGNILKQKPIDIVYCSPLLRTQQTAEIILEHIGKETHIITDSRIQEIDSGTMHTSPVSDWIAQFSAENRFHENPHQGESQADVEKRVLQFLQEVQQKHGTKNVLIITHGAVVRTVERYFHNLSEKEVFAFQAKTGALHEYSFSQLPQSDTGEADLHRPYIDKIQFDCPKCDGIMNRVPEVLDCWVESGSMPYASRWKEIKKEIQEKKIQLPPADFIAEGLDQTRGWFYTLHVLSNALFDQPAYKNVIVNGIVLAEDGQKMSKSKKNYPDPQIIFDKYGADAMRFYLMNSPVVRADNLKFTEEGVSEVMRKVLLPFWNVYCFFVTYANIDSWKAESIQETEESSEQKSPLDQWILAELRHLVQNFREKMDAYEIDAACREIPNFLDKLTNFYVRRSRRRFWKSEVDTDKHEAFQTLYTVLKTLSQVLAPICPFLSDAIWSNLKAELEPISVHHTDFPNPNDFPQNQSLRSEITAVRNILSCALAIRNKKKIRVRQPLSVLKIALPLHISKDNILKNTDIIQEEINVKSLEIVTNPEELAEQVAKPDARKLGPKFGKDVQYIIREAKAGNFVKNDDSSVTIAEKWKVQADEIEIGFLGKEGLDVESQHGIVVALDTEITTELREEGIAREIIRHIQELRKTVKYKISDRVLLGIQGAESIIETYAEMISEEVLAEDIQETLSDSDITTSIQIQTDGSVMDITLSLQNIS